MMKKIWLSAVTVAVACCFGNVLPGSDRQNVVLITLDDLGWDSLGCTGNPMPGVSPHIDELRSQGMMFTQAHIVTSICGPSRNAMLSGRYPHCSGMMGHGVQPPEGWSAPTGKTPSLLKVLQKNGYYTGGILKSSRLLDPIFDIQYNEKAFGMGFNDRDPETFYRRTRDFIEDALGQRRPFFLYVNPIDPHRPWPGTEMEKELRERMGTRSLPPSPHHYEANEVMVPPFLPDLPYVREHIAPYYDSVSRGDACVGRILDALADAGVEEDTLVVFCSDNGMAVPWAKWACYYYSLRTPLIVRWPGHTVPGSQDSSHVISSVDFLPTILDICGIEGVDGVEGASFMPLLQGETLQQWPSYAYAEQNYFINSTEEYHFPVRVVVGVNYLYVWNTYRHLESCLRPYYYYDHDILEYFESVKVEFPELEERRREYMYRPIEELFDIRVDPGCKTNLVERVECSDTLLEVRAVLREKMAVTGDLYTDLFDAQMLKSVGVEKE